MSDNTSTAHEAIYVDDGGDGYLACRCGYGHIIGDDALIDHIHDARGGNASESPRLRRVPVSPEFDHPGVREAQQDFRHRVLHEPIEDASESSQPK